MSTGQFPILCTYVTINGKRKLLHYENEMYKPTLNMLKKLAKQLLKNKKQSNQKNCC